MEINRSADKPVLRSPCRKKPSDREKNMTRKLKVLGMAAVVAILCSSPVSLNWSPTNMPSVSVDRAEARLGRPLTPGSVAGVNRRMHRRAYYGAAAVGAAAYGTHYYNRAACGYYPNPPCY